MENFADLRCFMMNPLSEKAVFVNLLMAYLSSEDKASLVNSIFPKSLSPYAISLLKEQSSDFFIVNQF